MAAMNSLSIVLNLIETAKNVIASYAFAVMMEKTILLTLGQFLHNFRSIFVYHLIINILDSKLGEWIQKAALSSFIQISDIYQYILGLFLYWLYSGVSRNGHVVQPRTVNTRAFGVRLTLFISKSRSHASHNLTLLYAISRFFEIIWQKLTGVL